MTPWKSSRQTGVPLTSQWLWGQNTWLQSSRRRDEWRSHDRFCVVYVLWGKFCKTGHSGAEHFYRGIEDGIEECCVIFKTSLHGANTWGSCQVRSTKLHTSHHLTSHKERDRLSAVCLLRLSWWKLSWVDAARAAAGVHVGGKQRVNQWLHQRLCYLHFSFLLGCVCNIHHCCFCISVHCGASGEEKGGEWDTANKRVGHINTGTERVFIVPVGEADVSRVLRCPTEPLCLCESITAITTLAALQTRWCLYRHIASLPSVD